MCFSSAVKALLSAELSPGLRFTSPQNAGEELPLAFQSDA